MKTFESQLLELLREYEKYEETFSTMNKYDFDFPGFYQWLSKRAEKKEEEKPSYKDIELPDWYEGETIATYELSSARFDSIGERDLEIQSPKEGQLCRIYDAHGNWDNYLYTKGAWRTVSLPLLII